MNAIEVQSTATAILTSIITGGFVLVLVEIGNRKNRENDRHEQIMQPFIHKLSAYFRFITWSRTNITYPNPQDDNETHFKELIHKISTYGTKIISGGDYEIDCFSAAVLHQIAFDINNIWYWHDKMRPCRLTWNGQEFGKAYIQKELKEINPMYLKITQDINLIAKVSGEFYTDIYQPIADETYRHEAHAKIYQRQTVIIYVFVCFVLLLLALILFSILSETWLKWLTFSAVFMLGSSLLMLAANINTQIKLWNQVENFIKSHISLKMITKKH